MIRRFLALIICAIGVILPWRLRVIFSELLGWALQFLYWLYTSLLKFMVRQLRPKEGKPLVK